MSLAPAVRMIRNQADLEAVRALFVAYAESLPVDLSYQGFDDEVATLPGSYAPKAGALWLARGAGGAPLGCVGLRPLAEGIGEMKRLYIRPEARGSGLGRRLAAAVIDRARELGYNELRLDTLPTMIAAAALYERLGFRQIGPYYAPAPSGTRFMAMEL